MFAVGDKVVYGSTGVCTVMDIGIPDIPGAVRECYILKPEYVSNFKVYAPVEENPVGMRPLLSRAAAQELIDSMPDIEALPFGREKQELHQACRDTIKSADSAQLAQLLKTLHQNKVRVLEQKKMVPSAEREYFDMAEKILYGELATVLQISFEDVQGYIAQRLEQGSFAAPQVAVS